MKTIAAYIRQSLNDPSSSSPERQLEVIEAWAKAHVMSLPTFIKTLEGNVSESENTKTRPEFQSLLKDAKAKRFDTIVVASQEKRGVSDVYAIFPIFINVQ